MIIEMIKAHPTENRMTRHAGPERKAVEGPWATPDLPQASDAFPKGDDPPPGRNHLHRVKPVARTEAMIDRQETQRSRGRSKDPARHLGVAGGEVASRFVWR